VEEANNHIKRKSIKKRILKVFLYFVLAVIALLIILYGLFQIPAIQTYAAKKAASYLSKRLLTDISVGTIHIGGFLDIVVTDLSIDDLHGNKILDARKIRLDLRRIKIRDHIIELNKVTLEESLIALRTYSSDSLFNLQFIFDNLSTTDTIQNVPPGKKWTMTCSGVSLKNCHFILKNEVLQTKPDSSRFIDFTNLDLSGLNISLTDLKIIEDTIWCNIKNLSFIERSGFDLRGFSAGICFSPAGLDAKDLKIETNNSLLDLDLGFKYNGFAGFGDFLNAVTIKAEIRHSEVFMEDIAYFTSALNGMNNKITLSGKISGLVSNLKLRDFLLLFGSSTYFSGNINVSGLPNIEETYVQLKIKELSTNAGDIEQFYLPGNADNHLDLPEILNVLGNIRVIGTFAGFYNDFVSKATFYTEIGRLSTDILLKNNRAAKIVGYSGKLEAMDLNLGILTGLSRDFGRMDMVASVTGQGLNNNTVDVKMDVLIDTLEFRNHKYKQIKIAGDYSKKKFNGLLSVNDPFIGLNFTGLIDFNGKIPQSDFIADIQHARLFDLGLSKRDTLAMFSTNINVNMAGNDLDNLIGKAKLSNTSYKEHHKEYRLNNLELIASRPDSTFRKITLDSDFIDASIEGEFYLSKLPQAFVKILDRYLTQLIPGDSVNKMTVNPQSFDLSVNLKDISILSELFFPGITLAPNSTLNGTYNSRTGQMEVLFNSPVFVASGLKFENYYLNGHTTDGYFEIITGASHLWLKEASPGDTLKLGIDALKINTRLASDSARIGIFWHDSLTYSRNTGNINGLISLTQYPVIDCRITSGSMVINDSAWTIRSDNQILIDTNAVTIKQLTLSGPHVGLEIDGTVSGNSSDRLTVKFNQFDFSYFNLLLKNEGIDMKGVINGQVTFANLLNAPNIIGDLTVRKFNFNQEELGDMTLKTNWDNVASKLTTTVEILYQGTDTISKTLEVTGAYYPNDNEHTFDFTINIYNYKLHTLYPFFSSFFSSFNGYASGNLYLKGSRSSPKLTGNVKVRRTEFRIGFLNTLYSLSDNIEFGNDYIGFNNVTVYDTLGRSAIVKGKIYHKFFSDIRLDLAISPSNFMGMSNTPSQSPLFYGDALATGEVKITGPVKNIMFDIKAKTEKGTKVFIPISYTADVSENNFIRFKSIADTGRPAPLHDTEISGLTMNFDLDVANDAVIQIFLPMQMGNIKVSGDGLMKLGINPNGEFYINGTYTMNSGLFYFTMKNLISRTFKIQEGGTISWTGDIYDARVSLKAVYQVRPSLSGLPITTGDTSALSQRIPVNCTIGLTGSLFNPDIHFSIDLPDASEDVRNIVYSAIDTTNEMSMTRQVLSLLVLNSFSFSTGGNNVMSGMGINTYEILANQLSNWLSQISDEFNIGVNYVKGNAMSPEQLELALSTQLFNDRVLINGSVGFGGYQNSANNASQVVGDVLIEAKITPDGRFRVRAYNKSNTIDLSNDNAPYTQGAGVSYRKDFNRFGDLFQRKRKKVDAINKVVLR
jgi:hypothetical protein